MEEPPQARRKNVKKRGTSDWSEEEVGKLIQEVRDNESSLRVLRLADEDTKMDPKVRKSVKVYRIVHDVGCMG